MKLKDGKSYNQVAHCGNQTNYRDILRESTLCQLHQMFRIEGLPDTIPEYVFLRNAFSNGWQFIHKPADSYISQTGDASGGSGLGPGYDYNYLPTHIVITNPYLNADGSIPDYAKGEHPGGYSATLALADGVLIKTTSELMGLDDLVNYFAQMEDTAATTLRMSLIISRMAVNWLAKSDDDKAAMEAYLKQIEEGKLGVALSKEWKDVTELALGANSGSASLLKSQIEALQYVRGYKWQTFGVQANHNMKREAINESEAGMNENSLLPLIDDIYANLKAGLDECNNRFGWNATISYASAWEEIQEATDEEVISDEISETRGDQSDTGSSPSDGSLAGGGDPDAGVSLADEERGEKTGEDDRPADS